jgi:hypothetical protein
MSIAPLKNDFLLDMSRYESRQCALAGVVKHMEQGPSVFGFWENLLDAASSANEA